MKKAMKQATKKGTGPSSAEDAIKEADYMDLRVQSSMQDRSKPPHDDQLPLESTIPIPVPTFDEEPAIQAMPHSVPSIQAAPHSIPSGEVVSLDPWTSAWDEYPGIKEAATMIMECKSMIVFSGAGISIPSISFGDLPPLLYETKVAIRDRNYYEYLKGGNGANLRDSYLFGSILKILEGKPNLGHESVAILNSYFRIMRKKFNIITQNLDYLHELAEVNLVGEKDADFSNVEHIHGWLKTATCPKCGIVHDYHSLLKKFQDNPSNNELLLCKMHSGSNCDGVLTPDMIEYGEQVVDYSNCAKIAKKADLILILGTSLRVIPANQLVDIVKNNKGKVLLFNRSDTPKDPMADLHVRSDLDCSLPILIHEIRNKIESKFKKKKKIMRTIEKIGIFDVESKLK
jgi:NAD-dependent deacetylase